ncbi:methyltransferase domain-containing protein [Diplodia corticola]|uniref:Methyltransferase domain-containing protein n=1 Tax=Diplodia corticola TaxID=236234 RepID=A0A1J9QR80_9PEZI|nr:methyltransferase domain-containing protein [Diplodia corticola]OJD30522.1 methyltransferase domain-containing protein [Diplodia corticola]
MADNNEQQPQVAANIASSKASPWYFNDIDTLTPQSRDLLETYSGIPPEEVEAHVKEVFPYPCIGTFRFLDLAMYKEPYYPEVLSRVKNGEKLLDLGCCFGQELRKLIHDGAPPTSLYGSDLRPEFLSLGHALFLDSSSLPTSPHFIAADIFADPDPSTSPLHQQLAGTLSIIHASAFFHLFSRADQLRAAERAVALLKPEPGVVVVGAQIGSPTPGVARSWVRRGGDEGKRTERFEHDARSWGELWEEVGARTGTRWEVVEARLTKVEERNVSPELLKMVGEKGLHWLSFWVKRVE